MILDLFGGPGGLDLGATWAGLAPIGIERDSDACATRAAARLHTIRADLLDFGPDSLAIKAGRLDGLMGSPPCPKFSAAGDGTGRAALGDLVRCLDRSHNDDLAWMELILEAGAWDGPGGDAELAEALLLLVSPLQWITALWPRWVVLEQVPPVLPFWEAAARWLSTLGYHTWAGVLCAADYGIVSSCPMHETRSIHLDTAESAEALSRSATLLATAAAFATTKPAEEPLLDAVTAMAHLAKAIELVCAEYATCGERARSLAALLACEAQTIPTGVAADTWTTEATPWSGWTAATAESIASSLSALWDDLYRNGKLSTTSTEIPRTTIRRILSCIAATLTTSPHTGTAARTAGCGLCVDIAVPQERRRAFLLANLDRPVHPPAATHAEHPQPDLFGGCPEPWVTMAEALGMPTGIEVDSGQNSQLSGGRVERYVRSADRPASTLTSRSASQWVLDPREHHKPLRSLDRPAQTLTGSGEDEARARYGDRAGTEAIKITIAQAAALQSFPPDYPFQGTKTSQARQIGNAVPPLMAQRIIEAVAA